MKWIIEIDDRLADLDRPFIGQTILDNGSKSPKLAYSTRDLIKILQEIDSDNSTFSNATSELVPANTLKKTIDGNKTIFSILIDKQMWDIKYQTVNDNHYIGLPKVIVQYVISNTVPFEIRSMKIVALKEADVIDNFTPLYKFPFPNVEKDLSTVCIDLTNKKYSSHKELDYAFRQFIAAPFNEDYGLALNKSKIFRFAEYLVQYADQSFNDELLVPLNQTISEF